MNITIDLSILLAVVLFFRLRMAGKPQTAQSVQITAALVLVFGLLLAGTDTGQALLGGLHRTVAALN